MADVPDHLHYTAEHEWIARAGDIATVGVTAYAADQLGDVVFVGLPPVGERIMAGDVCGELESTKSVSDLYAPVSGTVTEVNEAAADDPALINSAPYAAGWLFRAQLDGDPTDLLDAAGYATLTGGGDAS